MKTEDLLEDEEQKLFVKWCKRQEIFVFAIANQQPMAACCKSKSIVRNILNKLFDIGLKKGMPDLMIPIPSKYQHGLFIEMKKQKGATREKQKQILRWLKGQGYHTVVCYSFQEAQEETLKYLSRA